MSNKKAEVKLRLAKKYEQLAKIAKSKTKRKTYNHKAESYRFQAAQLAGFGLGDPPNLREVVNAVVADLTTLDAGDMAGSPARDAVYDSLRTHYPCDDS